MSRNRLLENHELAAEAARQVEAAEAAGVDASVLRAVGHRQDMFDRCFAFYYPAHQGRRCTTST